MARVSRRALLWFGRWTRDDCPNEQAFQEHVSAIQRYYDRGEDRELFAGCPPNDKYIY